MRGANMDSRKLMYQILERTIRKNLPLPESEVEKLAIIIFEKLEHNFAYESYDNYKETTNGG